MNSRLAFYRLLAAALILPAQGFAQERAEPAGSDFFEKQIRPLLVARCFKCHGGEKAIEGGLRLTSRRAILKGGETGPAAVPNKPAESAMLKALSYANELRMPPDAKLPQGEIDLLTRWVEQGLPWPADPGDLPATRGVDEPYTITAPQRQFWSFQPVKVVAAPAVKNATWAKSDLDRFILARLEAAKLAPTPAADKRTLLRRATFDLLGLPPTTAEIAAFLRDESPTAFAKVVDRLLESPHYGERWGRHWLDVVRYADSVDARQIGQPGDISEAYRYRDWVVDALNADYPYDRFVADQIAGDLLHQDDSAGFAAGLTATSMLAIGRWEQGEADKEKMVTDIIDDQIDVVGRGFLGLTLACARCHDHKFDPIPTEDYYSLAGIFFSSSILPDPGAKAGDSPRLRIPLTTPKLLAEREQLAQETAEFQKEAAEILGRKRAELLANFWEHLDQYLLAAAALAIDKLADDEASRKLDAALVRRLATWLAISGNSQPHLTGLLREKLTVVNPQSGIVGWGTQATPWIAANPGAAVARAGSLSVPPHSVAVHPGPDQSAAIGWRSPLSGKVAITGSLADADGNCGNGVSWSLERSRRGSKALLAEGRFANGGREDLPAKSLAEVDVAAGDVISLLVHPGERDHACDTTVVDLAIRDQRSDRVWSAADLAKDIQSANPHADSYGNQEVWHCYVTGATAVSGVPAGSALSRWVEVATGSGDHSALAKLTTETLQTLQAAKADQSQPDGKVRLALDDPAGPIWNGYNVASRLDPASRERWQHLGKQITERQQQLARPLPTVHGIREGGVPQTVHAGIHDAAIHIRGRYDRLGKLVPRRLPRILAGESQTPIAQGSGRVELARWVANADNPLTARVMVNRIWLHHFGEGLVRTPSNFGKLGQAPTHPELLDWLASRFVESGWSLKALHRTIMLSATYQQATQADPELTERDPENRLLGRMNRRRFDAEAIRDSLLAVAGGLDLTRGGPPIRDFNSPRRTLYVMTIRSDRSTFRDLFDAADPTAMVDQRINSTVAPQALFMLNHPFVIERTKQLAARAQKFAETDQARIEQLYELLYSRPPTRDESEAGKAILQEFRGSGAASPWEAYCQVLLCANEFLFIE